MARYQVGVLAYTDDDESKVVLVTTRGGSRWILPKGCTEKGRSDRVVALEEAYEEAGLIGTLHPRYVEMKTSNSKSDTLRIYRMRVKKVLKEWPEHKQRKRRLVPVSEAARLLAKDLRPFLAGMK